MKSRRVQTAGINLHVLEQGTGKPVIALHGFPESSHEWRGVANELADEWRVIAPDTRGHGQSEVTEEGYTRAHFAQDVVDLMDALEIERCPVIAHDWGGIIAVKLALDHGERVERLCLLDTLCTGFPAWANYYYWFMDGDRAEKFFAEHGADFIRSVIGGQVTQLPDPPGCPAEWTSPEMTAPVAWASEEDLETYYKPYTEGEGGWVSCQYYRNLKFNRVIEDAAAPFGERYEPVSMEEMGEAWRNCQVPYEYLDFAPEDRPKQYLGPTMRAFCKPLVEAAGVSLSDDRTPSGDPWLDAFLRHFPDLRTSVVDHGGHFFVEADPVATASLIRSFLTEQPG